MLAGSRTCRLTGVMRSPPARGSRWPFYRLAGHRFFSLRLTLSRGRGWSNVLECDSKFVRCVILIWWMTSCTVGTPRSLGIISLVTYRGASKIALNIFDWHLCMTLMLDLQAQPHNSLPYLSMIRHVLITFFRWPSVQHWRTPNFTKNSTIFSCQ